MKTTLLFWLSWVAWHAHTLANWARWDWASRKLYHAHGWVYCAWLQARADDFNENRHDS